MSTINLDNKTILVTGAAGFIGSNLVKRIYQEAPSATVVPGPGRQSVESQAQTAQKDICRQANKAFLSVHQI